jgi:hypothetical protein
MICLGIELHPDDQHLVLSAYVHRYTGDHKPNWANSPRPCGNPYPLQFKDDNEWLANTFFHIRHVPGEGNRLDNRFKHCESHPTWPNNPELRK